jgi:hypothetical protein
MALFGIAATYIWPDKKWIGCVCLVGAAILLLWWGVAEIRQHLGGGLNSLIIAIIFGCLLGGGTATLLWYSSHPSQPASSAPTQPVINWETPSAIAAGTPLTETQLNAKADVDATPSYLPDVGTVLPVGRHALTVTFTPTDHAKYSLATAKVYIVVIPASPKPPAPMPATSREPKLAPEAVPEITADFVQGTSPGLLMMNKSAAVIRDPMCSYAMWNLSKNPPLMIPSWEVRESGAFIKPNSGRILATADTPQAKPYIAIGDRIFALLIVDCPDCKSGRIYYLYFVYGDPASSWFAEAPEGTASNLLLVSDLLRQSDWNPEIFLTKVPHLPVRRLEPPTGIISSTQP